MGVALDQATASRDPELIGKPERGYHAQGAALQSVSHMIFERTAALLHDVVHEGGQ